MDYLELLKKYMAHIKDCESIDYVDQIGDYCSEVVFTDEQKAELKKLSAEARQCPSS
jgi:hypothetical protein